MTGGDVQIIFTKYTIILLLLHPQWLRHPSNPRDIRNLGVDVICGVILSPLVMISAWLCLNGSTHYMHHEERSLEGMGLILLAAVLLAIFMTWSLVRCSLDVLFLYSYLNIIEICIHSHALIFTHASIFNTQNLKL